MEAKQLEKHPTERPRKSQDEGIQEVAARRGKNELCKLTKDRVEFRKWIIRGNPPISNMKENKKRGYLKFQVIL